MRLVYRSMCFGAALAVALLVTELSAQRPPLADEAISKDRASRAVLLAKGKWSAAAAQAQHKPGFFGTIFQLVKDQINDTKSAYSQISELVNNQFTDDVTPASAGGAVGGNATEAPTKISRAEFLRILDRNLKGLRRLRELEWREAKKDSTSNIRAYKEEAFRGKNSKGR